VGRAIVARAPEIPPVSGFGNDAGLGVRGVVEGHAVVVGRQAEVPVELAEAKAAAERDGRTVVLVSWDGDGRGLLLVADAVNPTSAEAVAELRALGLHPVLLTGDNAAAARAVAGEVGI